MEEQLLAALKVAKGCLDGHTSIEVWDLVENTIAQAEAQGLGQSNHTLPEGTQRLLSEAIG